MVQGLEESDLLQHLFSTQQLLVDVFCRNRSFTPSLVTALSHWEPAPGERRWGLGERMTCLILCGTIAQWGLGISGTLQTNLLVDACFRQWRPFFNLLPHIYCMCSVFAWTGFNSKKQLGVIHALTFVRAIAIPPNPNTLSSTLPHYYNCHW